MNKLRRESPGAKRKYPKEKPREGMQKVGKSRKPGTILKRSTSQRKVDEGATTEEKEGGCVAKTAAFSEGSREDRKIHGWTNNANKDIMPATRR